MSRELGGVTIETFSTAVRKMGLQRGQPFKIVVEDDKNEGKRQAFERMQEISATVTARVQADGIVTDEDVERFLNS